MSASTEMDVFCRVVDRGSFSAAALELGLTPSAVSKIVSRTEDRLGVKLLSRTTRRLSLTSEGEAYLERAREILGAISAAEDEIAQSGREPSGVLRVNTGPTFGRHMLMGVLPEFLARYPRIELQLDITDRRVDLEAERADVAIRTGPLEDSRLVARKLMEGTRLICASPAYLERHGIPETPDDLSRHQCLLISGYSSLASWPFDMPEGRRDLRIQPRSTSDSADVVRDMAVAGLGIARLFEFTIREELASGSLVSVLEDVHSPAPFPFTILMVPERQHTPRVRAFVDFLVEKFASGV